MSEPSAWNETSSRSQTPPLNNPLNNSSPVTLEGVLLEAIAEQKRARRWRYVGLILKPIFWLLLLGGLIAALQGQDAQVQGPHTAVVRVEGVILDQQAASAERIVSGLKKAFAAAESQAVVLRINSPGGSPVQAGIIYDAARRLRQAYPEKPLYAVIEDLGTSGAYYIAAAADQIIAHRSSLVGSIGVIAAGFGFDRLLENWQIERRVFTAGEDKAFLDPFSAMTEAQKAHWQATLDYTHQQFIESVRQGRGDRLPTQALDTVFSGRVWNAQEAVELGLIDQLGDIYYLSRELIQAENLVDYTPEDTPFEAFTRQMSQVMLNVLQQTQYSQKPWLLP
ncbi:protease-4 [Allopseudospirillum japonicum]|uniref:Protease-4 n=1 Tax=Allopseudospirillum japonicum TaxID=64971 RepID=A0A1H6S2L3_9GAMM|nr:S49 family peptidase [Allopseudospirillum japonicum]SEI60926.1 protease-4 [Allopseudospirillum japonicum]